MTQTTINVKYSFDIVLGHYVMSNVQCLTQNQVIHLNIYLLLSAYL